MITRVVLTVPAEKDLSNAPPRIAKKFYGWTKSVELLSLEQVRRIPGYHDEPLKGQRAGQRSIRLSKSWRAIYEIRKDGSIEFVSIEEITKHKY